jgi:hypothetical protein
MYWGLENTYKRDFHCKDKKFKIFFKKNELILLTKRGKKGKGEAAY